MPWSRRAAVMSLLAGPLLAAVPRRARAATAHYPMAVDPTLADALRAASEAFRARTDIFVHILPTSASLLVPQMTHQIQNDIVMARADIVDGVDAAGYAVPGAPRPQFRSRLVLATRVDLPEEAIKSGPFALVDPGPDTVRDDRAILAALGLPAAHPLGGIDSGEVAYLVSTGAAAAGLMLMSDVRSNPSLKPVREVPETLAAPVVFTAQTTRVPRRPEPEAFVSFLASAEGAALLAKYGLEKMA